MSGTAKQGTPLVQGPANESEAQLSPDGKWLAYHSDESGVNQIDLRGFDGANPADVHKWVVSDTSARGMSPRWRADGKELFYLQPVDGSTKVKLMAAPIGTGPNPAAASRMLFEFTGLVNLPANNAFQYSPAPDGQRFLINVYATAVEPTLEVVLNWAGTK